jgi:GSH-dependent disulfide-bond oxidoreductase
MCGRTSKRAPAMIDLYAWTTPNGRKMSVMLEETQLDYRVHRVDIGKGEQFAPDFLKISPNNKIPAIVDSDAPGGPLSVFESGAILTYLAERSGRFLPSDARGRAETLQWVFWQVGGFGPLLGQFNHFLHRAEKGVEPADVYALQRFTDEAARLFRVLEMRLSATPHVAGDAFSIADIAIYPWSVYIRPRLEAATATRHPNIARWEGELALRPALARGMASLAS